LSPLAKILMQLMYTILRIAIFQLMSCVI